MNASISIHGLLGWSASRRVFIGFAPARVLHSLSFADVLNEDTRQGYQRKFNPKHSLDFRRYIQQANSTTIPLTFNLRPSPDQIWKIEEHSASYATLEVREGAERVLAQVDCQHRLGYLEDVDAVLPFMTYIGLSVREEMEIFNTINSKAKGLSTSLLDFHDATLASDLAAERPELFIALQLNAYPDSPWFQQLDLGGTTSGLHRRASLRTMQKAVKRFLAQTNILDRESAAGAAKFVLDFWSAVATVLKTEWEHPRKYLLCKGVGVYALMGIAADLFSECNHLARWDQRSMIVKLGEFLPEIDWSTDGTLKGLGGEVGVKSALRIIRNIRSAGTLKVSLHAE